jgi:hypothetical protein
MKTYVGARTASGCSVHVSCSPLRPGTAAGSAPGIAGAASDVGSAQWEGGALVGRSYRLRWTAGADSEWNGDELARALLVDLFAVDSYRTRRDLHRALANEVLARLPHDRWVLTTRTLVDWLVETHATSMGRQRVGATAEDEEGWLTALPETPASIEGTENGARPLPRGTPAREGSHGGGARRDASAPYEPTTGTTYGPRTPRALPVPSFSPVPMP